MDFCRFINFLAFLRKKKKTESNSFNKGGGGSQATQAESWIKALCHSFYFFIVLPVSVLYISEMFDKKFYKDLQNVMVIYTISVFSNL